MLRVLCNRRLVMAATEQQAKSPVTPWWVRYTRWTQTNEQEALVAEKILLDFNKIDMKQSDHKLGGQDKQRHLHVLSGGKQDGPLMVATAGYGAGAGFWYKNYNAIMKDFKLHSVDMLGCGLSGRPPFNAQTREEAENFFVESLEEWRAQASIDKMILMGHSMGGYLMASYAIAHPDRVQHLVLVGPAGISTPPPDAAKPSKDLPLIFRAVRSMWDWGLTPGMVTRALGPWGPGVIRGYTSRRFVMDAGQSFNEQDKAVFENYFYHIMAQPGSGEHCLRHLLAPGAWARAPLEDRLHDQLPASVPVTFIYGDKDWMRPDGGHRTVDKLQNNGKDGEIRVIEGAGHYVFMDKPREFEAVLRDALKRWL